MNRAVRLLLAGVAVCLVVRVGAFIIGPALPVLVVLLVLAVVARVVFAGPRLRQ